MESLRTTIVLEKELYRQAKRLALEQDKTLKEIIEQALRSYLRGDQQRGQGRGGPIFRHHRDQERQSRRGREPQ